MSADLYLFNDISNKRLMQSASAGGAATATLPILFALDTYRLNWYALSAGANSGLAPAYLNYATASLKISANKAGAAPTGGSAPLTWGGDTTATEISPTASDVTVAAALNALASITTAGGVTVTSTTVNGVKLRQVRWNIAGVRDLITSDDAGLMPQSSTIIGRLVVGDVNTRETQELRYYVHPPIFQDTFTNLPAASATVTVLQVGDVTHNARVKFTLDSEVTSGTFALSATLPDSVATGQISHAAVVADVQTACTAAWGADNTIVTLDADGVSFIVEFQGDLELTDIGTFAVNVDNLIAPLGKTGTLALNGEYLNTLLDAADPSSLILEIEVTPAGGSAVTVLHSAILVSRAVTRIEAIEPIETRSGLGSAARRDVGTSAGQVIALDDDAKLPAVDGSQLTHLPGSGGDVVGPAEATDGAVATYDGDTGKLLKDGVTLGNVSTLDVGTTTGTVAAGDDSRLSDPRTPTAHAASHEEGEADALSPADIGACADDDSRLSDARTPSSTLAHKGSHATGQADALAPGDIGAAVAGAAPAAHKSSHATGQADALAASDIGAAASNHNHDGTYIAALAAGVADTAARLALTAKPLGFHAHQADDHSIYEVANPSSLSNEGGWAKVADDVLPFAPTMTGNPSISGTEQVGETLTASSGTASGRPTPAHYSWKWQVSDTGTGGWSDIEGAASGTYVPVSGDEGKYLRVAEKFSSDAGTSDWAYSAATGAIAAAETSYHWQVKNGATSPVADAEHLGSGYTDMDDGTIVIPGATTNPHRAIRVVEGVVTGSDLMESYQGDYYGVTPPTGSFEVTGGTGSGLQIIFNSDAWETFTP